MIKDQENQPSPSSPETYSLIPKTFCIADIVISMNGRDAGKNFIVIETDDGYCFIADGKRRRYEKPKRKKNKHLKLEDKADIHMAEKLIEGGKITNNEIRRYLAGYAAKQCSEGGIEDAKK